ncbi:hypothetical protein BDQ17DRAFT_1324394 [Cyathus striatus]|nr:hypothetical protein BDQ17DRAFT_1324394 [Cyathus striatus]
MNPKNSLIIIVLFALTHWDVFANSLPTLTQKNPNTAVNIQEWYSPGDKAHFIDSRYAFISSNFGGSDFQFQGDIFRAWQTQETGTVPLFSLFNPTNTDWMFLIPSSNGALPSAPGIPFRICGSVPLFSVFSTSIGDHWYTLDTNERDHLTQNGFGIDAGIVGFVLPLNTF